ncbi:hypothetical protein chiPu_0032785, partial [Chiloscyllium punctatum]|nr:hypothetical protein [Chiloscyllium punctatum]
MADPADKPPRKKKSPARHLNQMRKNKIVAIGRSSPRKLLRQLPIPAERRRLCGLVIHQALTIMGKDRCRIGPGPQRRLLSSAEHNLDPLAMTSRDCPAKENGHG